MSQHEISSPKFNHETGVLKERQRTGNILYYSTVSALRESYPNLLLEETTPATPKPEPFLDLEQPRSDQPQTPPSYPPIPQSQYPVPTPLHELHIKL